MEHGLPANNVRAIIEDRDGVVWAATSGGLARFRGAGFEPVLLGAETADDIRAIVEDSDGGLWLATVGGGLLRWRQGEYFRFTTVHGLPDDTVIAVLDDARGRLWLACRRGLFSVGKAELDEVRLGRLGAMSPREYTAADGLRSGEFNGGAQPQNS